MNKTFKYNHAYSIGFSVDSNSEDGSGDTPEMIISAILDRVASLMATGHLGEIMEAVGAPYDTYENQSEEV